MTPPPLPQDVYFLYLNNQQQGGFNFQMVANLIAQQQVNTDSLIWKQGTPNWVKIDTLQEFANIFNGQTPPPLPPNT